MLLAGLEHASVRENVCVWAGVCMFDIVCVRVRGCVCARILCFREKYDFIETADVAHRSTMHYNFTERARVAHRSAMPSRR